MGYADTYASNHARILSDLARSQAEAKLQSGAAWGKAIGNIGQIAANLPGQLADERRAKQKEQIWQANIDKFNQERQEDQWLKDAMKSSVRVGPDGMPNIEERALAENLQVLGAGDLIPDALETVRKSTQAAVELRTAQAQGRLTQDELTQLERKYIRTLAPIAVAAQFDPVILNGLFAKAEHDQFDVADWKALSKADPAKFQAILTEMAKPPVKTTSLAKGAKLVNEATGAMIADNPDDAPKKSFQNQPIMFNGKPMMANFDPSTGEYFKPGSPGQVLVGDIQPIKPQGAAVKPDYREVNTVDAAGNPITNYMTAEEVRAQGGIKGAPKTTAKASGPATVDAIMTEIEDLSKRINTSAGGPMSNVTGALRRGAAAGNMDNDVSEYQALVEGFIPMVARAVGHSGVLTQQDVDSVRALFPRPGDNATLSKNKMDRVKKIMQQMQSPGEAPARAGGAGGAGGGKAADPLGIRPGGG